MNEKILVVEDDKEIAEVIKEYLGKRQYKVIWASTKKNFMKMCGMKKNLIQIIQ